MRAIVRTSDVSRLEREGLVAVAAVDVSAIASLLEGAPAPDAAQLRMHERITGRIHEIAPSLPSRFGQFFPDDRSLAAALRDRRPELSDALGRLGDRAEMSVTLSWREPRAHPDTRDASTGREFLEAKALREREHSDARAVVARLVEHLAFDQAVIRHNTCPRDGVAAIVAVLIERDGAAALRSQIDSFEERSNDVTVVVYGPLPPYSFAS